VWLLRKVNLSRKKNRGYSKARKEKRGERIG